METKRINLDTAAKVLGHRAGNFRTWLHKAPEFKDVGQRHRGERFLSLGEVMLLHLVAEMVDDDARTFGDIVASALSAMEYLDSISIADKSGDGPDIFAVMASGMTEAGYRQDRAMCHGADEVGEFCRSAASKGWHKLRVYNLSALYLDVLIAWNVVTGGTSVLKEHYERLQAQGTVEEKAAAYDALNRLEMIQKRIAGQRVVAIEGLPETVAQKEPTNA